MEELHDEEDYGETDDTREGEFDEDEDEEHNININSLSGEREASKQQQGLSGTKFHHVVGDDDSEEEILLS